jgi:predicted negative regulator of RcsB-dependent stress response
MAVLPTHSLSFLPEHPVASKKKTEGDDVAATDDAGDAATPGFNPEAVHIGGESIADRILPHIKKIMYVIVGVTVVMSIFFTWRWWQHKKAVKATAAFSLAIDEVGRDIEPPPADGEPAEPPPGPDDPPKPVTYPSASARAEAVLKKLGAVEGDPRSGGALLEAAMLFDAGKLDDAERRYRALSSKRGIEGIAAREALGFIAEARADAAKDDAAARTQHLEAALAAFRAMQPDDAGSRRAWALYHEGRILAALGKRDEARTAFTAAVAKAEPDLLDTVEMRLTQLDALAAQ